MAELCIFRWKSIFSKAWGGGGQMAGIWSFFENFHSIFHLFLSMKKKKIVFFQKKLLIHLIILFYMRPVNFNKIGQVVPKKCWLPFSKYSFEINTFKVFSFRCGEYRKSEFMNGAYERIGHYNSDSILTFFLILFFGEIGATRLTITQPIFGIS